MTAEMRYFLTELVQVCERHNAEIFVADYSSPVSAYLFDQNEHVKFNDVKTLKRDLAKK